MHTRTRLETDMHCTMTAGRRHAGAEGRFGLLGTTGQRCDRKSLGDLWMRHNVDLLLGQGPGWVCAGADL